MKTSKKSLLVALTALLIVGIMIFCAACNPYKGNYKEVSEENREQVVADMTEKLNALDPEKMDKFQITYRISTEMGTEEQKIGSTIELTITVDGNKTKTIVKMSGTDGEETTEVEAIIWTNADTADIFYKITSDGKTETGKYSGGESEQDPSGDSEELLAAEESDGALESIIAYGTQAREQYIGIVEMLIEALTEESSKLYTDGDKLKIVAEEEDSKLEAYVIFNKNDTIRCKIEATETSDYGTMSLYVEVIPTAKSVSMPNYK